MERSNDINYIKSLIIGEFNGTDDELIDVYNEFVALYNAGEFDDFYEFDEYLTDNDWHVPDDDDPYEYDDIYEMEFDDIPEGCAACGGPYPSCISSCNLFEEED